MSIRNIGVAALLGGVAAMSTEAIQRPYYSTGPALGGMVRYRNRSGTPGLTFAEKKRRRKIARASRRYNLRTGA